MLHPCARIGAIRENKVIKAAPRCAHRRRTLYGAAMRHVGTLIAAAVIAPLVWIMVAFGQAGSARAFARAQDGGALHTGDFVRPLEYLAVAGLLRRMAVSFSRPTLPPPTRSTRSCSSFKKTGKSGLATSEADTGRRR